MRDKLLSFDVKNELFFSFFNLHEANLIIKAQKRWPVIARMVVVVVVVVGA